MAGKNKGYILLSRSLQDNWIWNDVEPFDHRSAWVDLIMMANHEDRKIGDHGSYRTIRRGQLKTSIDKLQVRWRWSEGKVKRFLNNLIRDGMVLTDSSTRGTIITLVNYGVYQDSQRTNGATDRGTDRGTDEGTDRGTDRGTDGPQTNNYKELKRTKKELNKSSAPSSSQRGDTIWQ